MKDLYKVGVLNLVHGISSRHDSKESLQGQFLCELTQVDGHMLYDAPCMHWI